MLNDKEEEAFRIFISECEEYKGNNSNWDDDLHLELYTSLSTFRMAFKRAIDSLISSKESND